MMEHSKAYKFRINAYSRDTMPMARLVEYMSELSKILGEQDKVHLIGIENGSTVPVLQLDDTIIPTVTKRLIECASGKADDHSLKAWRRINALLEDDKADASIEEEEGGKIIIFPGAHCKNSISSTMSNIKQHSEIEGFINRIGGTKEKTIHVGLEIDGIQINKCETTKEIAKQLAKNLFDPVRLYGEGIWNRTSEGSWELVKFKIEYFEILDNDSICEAVSKLRAKHKNAICKDALNKLFNLRNGN